MTGMKLVSPPHLGTTCWCRWAAIPAPATVPRFIPRLNPCGADTARRATIVRLVKSLNSPLSAAVSSV